VPGVPIGQKSLGREISAQKTRLATPGGPWYIRLRIADIIDAVDVAHLRELFDLGSRALHNQPFGRERARMLEAVTEFIER